MTVFKNSVCLETKKDTTKEHLDVRANHIEKLLKI